MKMRRLLMLLWLPAMACAAYAQQSFYGTTVSGVSLSADADPADQARIPIKAGDVITAENVRASIQALFDTGPVPFRRSGRHRDKRGHTAHIQRRPPSVLQHV